MTLNLALTWNWLTIVLLQKIYNCKTGLLSCKTNYFVNLLQIFTSSSNEDKMQLMMTKLVPQAGTELASGNLMQKW
jgi:hypothetical protein